MVSKQTPGMHSQKLSKQERRAAARERERRLREQQQQRERRNKFFAILAGVVILGLIVFGVARAFMGGNAPETKYDGTARPAASSNVQEDGGISVNADGVAGKAVDGAPVIGIWSDYMCGGCQQLDLGYHDKYVQYAKDGDLGFTLYPVATLGHDLSKQGAAALYYVAEFAPEYAWEFNNKIVQLTANAQQAMPTADDFAAAAAEIGVPEDVVNDLPASVVADDWQAMVTKVTEEFRANEYTGTPTITVDGKQDQSWLEQGPDQLLEKAAGKEAADK